jgi:hypothetical protein
MFRYLVALALAGLFLACAPAHAAPPPPVEAYARLPAMENVSLSPSGARYAYIVVDGDERKLVVASVDDNQALFASDFGEAKVVGVYWAGEDHLMVKALHTVDLGPEFELMKSEFSAVIAINVTTGKAISIFSGDPTVLSGSSASMAAPR